MATSINLATKFLIFIFTLLLCIIEHGINCKTSTALHLVPFNDPSIKMFPEPGSPYEEKLVHFRINLLNPNKTKLIVGAKQHIFQLDLETFDLENSSSSKNIIKLTTPEKYISLCRSQFLDKEECANYMMFAVFKKDNTLFACGTYATETRCWEINANNFTLRRMHKGEDGMVQNALVSKSRNARILGFCAANQVIIDVITDYDYTGTKQSSMFGLRTNNFALTTAHNHFTFTDATFISAYEANDGFIYFFFTETAREVTERKTVYSRVSRVCQYDTGPQYQNMDTFITFRKSQIVCYKKGKVPDYYDIIQSATAITVNDEKGNPEVYFYASFTTTMRSTGSSAICRYRLKDIQNLFQTSKYYKRITNDLAEVVRYEPVNHPYPLRDAGRLKCDSNLDTQKSGESKFGPFYTLMYQDSDPYDKTAVAIFRGERVTALAVEGIRQHGNKTDDAMHVLFTGTESGEIYKVVMNKSTKGDPIFVEKIQVTKGVAGGITKIDFYKNYLIASGPNMKLYKIRKERCESSYLLCSDCVKSRDPYCAWSLSQKKCTRAMDLPPSDRLQNVATGNDSNCPPVDIHISCSLRIIDNIPGARTALQCTGYGILPPKVIAWKRGGTILNIKNIYELIRVNATSQILVIKDYTTDDLGTYGCVVGAGRNKSVCTVTLTGMKPAVNCSSSYANCSCEITGHPFPTIRKVVNGNQTMKVSQPGPFFIESGAFVFAMNSFGEDIFSCQALSRPVTTATTTAMKTTTTTAPTTRMTSTNQTTTQTTTTVVESTTGTTTKPTTKKIRKSTKASTTTPTTELKSIVDIIDDVTTTMTTVEPTQRTPATPGQRKVCPASEPDKYFYAFIACLVLLLITLIILFVVLYFVVQFRNNQRYDDPEDEYDGHRSGTLNVSGNMDREKGLSKDHHKRHRKKVRKTDSSKPLVKDHHREPKNGFSKTSPTKHQHRSSSKNAQEMDDLMMPVDRPIHA